MTKQQQRQKANDARNAQRDKTQLSKIICKKFITQSSYQQAQTVMWYLHCRSEVKTFEAVSAQLRGKKTLVIPFCTKDQKGENKLGLWKLEDLSELMPGTWGILEPPKSRWNDKDKLVLPEDLDLIMVPGLAFDLKGGRLGNGAGYYDRLLQKVRPDTLLTAVCYESQIVDKVMMVKHDVYMDCLFTEKNSYQFSKL